MIFEELVEPAPVDVGRLMAQQDRERAARNERNLERQLEADFGPLVAFLVHRWPIPPTPAEIDRINADLKGSTV